MESIVSYFSGIGIDLWSFLKLACVLFAGALIITSVCRFIFRKQTMFSSAVSSSIAIIFIYVVTILLITVATELDFLVTPLPFVSIAPSSIHFFSFNGASVTNTASELLSMVILAFLVNLVDGWMPKRKNIFRWLLWKCFTVAICFILHYLVTWLFNRYLPQVIVLYAPIILLVILIVMLLTGALKLLVGLLLTTVNPIIGALYTFFFASVVGKHLTKAVLTTAILCGAVYLLQDMGIAVLALTSGALVAYIPFLLVLILVWYLVGLL